MTIAVDLGRKATKTNKQNGFDEIEPGKLVDFNDNCTRGHLFKIQKPSCKKKLRMVSFPKRCINRWNSLSEEIVSSDKSLVPDRYILTEIY